MEKKVIGIFILVGLLLYRVLLIFSYNGELAGIDNNFVYDVTRAIGGFDIYTHPASAPYSITLYSPLYFNICTWIGKLLHINPEDPIQVYQLCRTVSLLCDISTCFILGRLLHRRSAVSKEYSWLGVAVFACILCLLGYTFSRSDSMLLTFYAATLYVLTNPALQTIARPLLLALLSAGCILSKQNGLIVPVLILTWLLLQKEKKVAVQYAGFFVIIFGAAVYIYHAVYPALFNNTISSLNNRIDLSWFYTDIFKRMMNSLWILPLYVAAVIAVRQWLLSASVTNKAWAALFIIQTLFSLVTSLKWGSTAGYFNESFLLAFIIILRLTFRAQTEPQRSVMRNITLFCLPLLLLFFLHTVAEGYLFFLQHRQGKKLLYEHQKQVRDYLEPKLESQYVLNLASPNSDFFKTIFYKDIAVPNMDMVSCCTLPDNTFDYSNLRQDLTNGRIGYLILHEDDNPETLWGVSLDHFKIDTMINGYSIYH